MNQFSELVALAVGLFLLLGMVGVYVRRRWRARFAKPVTAPSQVDVTGTVYGLIPDQEYQVMQSFTDFYGNVFERGQRLHFKQRNFSPYHAGHTIFFVERPLYLQEDRNKDILDNFSAYVAPLEQQGP